MSNREQKKIFRANHLLFKKRLKTRASRPEFEGDPQKRKNTRLLTRGVGYANERIISQSKG